MRTDEGMILTQPYVVVAYGEKGPLMNGSVTYQYIGGDLSVACKDIMEEGDYDVVYLISDDDHIIWKQTRERPTSSDRRDMSAHSAHSAHSEPSAD